MKLTESPILSKAYGQVQDQLTAEQAIRDRRAAAIERELAEGRATMLDDGTILRDGRSNLPKLATDLYEALDLECGGCEDCDDEAGF